MSVIGKELFVGPLHDWVSRQMREPTDPSPASQELPPPVAYALNEVIDKAVWRATLLEPWLGVCEQLMQRETAHRPLLDGTALPDVVPAVRSWVAESIAAVPDTEVWRPTGDPEELVESLILRLLDAIRDEATQGAGHLAAIWHEFRVTQLGGQVEDWRDYWNPPGTAAGFVGRESELAALHRDESPLWLYGAKGVGKTALAVSYAGHTAAAFDGRVMVDFGADYEGPKTADTALREVLAATDPSMDITKLHSMDSAELEALWHTVARGKRLFMLWDNVADPAQLAPLLVDHAGSRTIVTSRQPHDEMRQLRLDRLDLHEAIELFTKISGIDDRFTAARIVATDRYWPQLLELYALGLRAGAYSASELLAELEGLPREETPAAQESVDIVYRRLGPAEQHILRMFGIHPGRVLPVSTIAKMSGVGFGETARLLEVLEGTGLLRCQDSAPRDNAIWTYRAPDLVRDFAQTRVEPSESAKAHAELVLWYLDRLDIRSAVGDELPAIMDFILSGAEVAHAQIAMSLGAMYRRTGRYAESLTALRHAAEVFGRRGFRLGAGEARFLLSEIAATLGDTSGSAAHMEAAVADFRAAGNWKALGTAMWALAQLYIHRGRCGAAREGLAAAAEIFDVLGDRETADLARATPVGDAPAAWRAFGEVCARRGNIDRRRSLSEIMMAEGNDSEAMVLLGEADRRDHDEHGHVVADNTVLRAALLLRQGESARARQCFEEARRKYREADNRHGTAHALTGLGDVAVATEDFDEARRLWREAITTFTAIGAEANAKRCRDKLSDADHPPD